MHMQQSTELLLEMLQTLVKDLVVLVDPTGKIIMFNHACEALTGHRRDEVLGRNLMELFVPPEWTEIVKQRFANPFAPEAALPHENPWKTRSGQERFVRWRCTPFRVDDGEAPYILGIGTDVTEQRQVEEKARTQARLLEHFFESTLTCAVLLDREFNFIRVNQAYARACQRDASEFPGHNHFDFYPSDARAIFEEVVCTRQPYVVESRPFRFPDHPEWGVTYWDWMLVPVLDDQGEIELLLLCLNDVTQRERAKRSLQDAMTQLHKLSRQLVDIQEQERRRIARELHDEIGQGLTALKLALENSLASQSPCPRMKEALATVADLQGGVRRIACDLRPPMLDDLGLLSALVWLFEKYQSQAGLMVNFRHAGLDARLPQDLETAMFRICQEALANIVRHAGAHEAEVALWQSEDGIVLRVEDKGCGFDPSNTDKSGGGAGLLGMRERAGLLGGTLSIDTSPGAGTCVTAEIPLNRRKMPAWSPHA